MKTLKNAFFSLLLSFLLLSCNSENKIDLFNGENLDNWDTYVSSPDVAPGDLFWVEQGVIHQDEADVFNHVHTAIDEYLSKASVSGMGSGPRADALPQILEAMLKADLIDQDQADTFLDVHDRLIEAGLMQ